MTSLAHGMLRSVIGMMRTCSGASQVGNAPAKCSVMTPMKRSMRAEHNAVDHDRTVLLAVCAGVFKLKALRQLHIQLDGAALPGTADGVRQMEVELRTVERAVTLVDHVVLANLGRSRSAGRLVANSQSFVSPM